MTALIQVLILLRLPLTPRWAGGVATRSPIYIPLRRVPPYWVLVLLLGLSLQGNAAGGGYRILERGVWLTVKYWNAPHSLAFSFFCLFEVLGSPKREGVLTPGSPPGSAPDAYDSNTCIYTEVSLDKKSKLLELSPYPPPNKYQNIKRTPPISGLIPPTSG